MSLTDTKSLHFIQLFLLVVSLINITVNNLTKKSIKDKK